MIREAMGEELYQRLYGFLLAHRQQDPPSEPEYSEIKAMVGHVRALLNLAMKLDDIIFHEVVLEKIPSMAQL